MRNQPSDNNNPANPLMKVAALTLDKERVGETGNAYRVLPSLTFKKSSDMRGVTTTKDGREVTVSFTLSVSRATFTLQLLDDRDRLENRNIRMTRVAFVNSLVKRTSVNEAASITDVKSRKRSALLKTKAGAALTTIDCAANVGVAAGLIDANKSKRTRTKKTTYTTVNVNATVAGGEIHWEITPNPEDTTENLHVLNGSVFQTANSSASIAACHIARKDGTSMATTTVRGAVFTDMANLHVDEVAFRFSGGERLSLGDLKAQLGGKQNLGEFALCNIKTMKERILKEIIRKHLQNQGMHNEGSSIEICRAST